jgi:hypothetical protein
MAKGDINSNRRPETARRRTNLAKPASLETSATAGRQTTVPNDVINFFYQLKEHFKHTVLK